MNLAQLDCFLAIADELHFGRAAARLQVETSTLSKRIRDLEAELGVRLFSRTTRRVALTPEGAVLVGHAERVVAEAATLRAVASASAAGHSGRIWAAYAPGTGEDMATLVRAVRHRYPDVTVSVEIHVSVEVAHAVHRGDASFGICNVAPSPDLYGVASLVLGTSTLEYVLVSLDHRFADRPKVAIRELDGETLVLPTASILPYMQGLSEGDFTDMNIRIRRENAADEAALVDLVAAGYGIFICTADMLRRNRREDVVAVPLVGSLPDVHRYLIWRADNDSPVVRSVLALAGTAATDTARLGATGARAPATPEGAAHAT